MKRGFINLTELSANERQTSLFRRFPPGFPQIRQPVFGRRLNQPDKVIDGFSLITIDVIFQPGIKDRNIPQDDLLIGGQRFQYDNAFSFFLAWKKESIRPAISAFQDRPCDVAGKEDIVRMFLSHNAADRPGH